MNIGLKQFFKKGAEGAKIETLMKLEVQGSVFGNTGTVGMFLDEIVSKIEKRKGFTKNANIIQRFFVVYETLMAPLRPHEKAVGMPSTRCIVL